MATCTTDSRPLHLAWVLPPPIEPATGEAYEPLACSPAEGDRDPSFMALLDRVYAEELAIGGMTSLEKAYAAANDEETGFLALMRRLVGRLRRCLRT